MMSIGGSDLEWQFFRAGGKGGQAQNKKSSGARVIHRESGAVGESRTHRDQLHNRREALRRMAKSFRFLAWLHDKEADAAREESIEQEVARELDTKNLKIEVRVNGKWVEE